MPTLTANLINGNFDDGVTDNGSRIADVPGWEESENNAFNASSRDWHTATGTINGVLTMNETRGATQPPTEVWQVSDATVDSTWSAIHWEFQLRLNSGWDIPTGGASGNYLRPFIDLNDNGVYDAGGVDYDISTAALRSLNMQNLAKDTWHNFSGTLDLTSLSADAREMLNGHNYGIYLFARSDNADTPTTWPVNGIDLSYDVVCFAHGTYITTRNGPITVEQLRKGDLILTRDNGLQPIRWIGSHKLSAEMLAAAPNLRPIRIRAGSLGKNTPANDLIVSPQHRILVRSKIAQRMFGTDEILVAAKHLLEIDGIDVADDLPEVEYFHFMFDRHEIVWSNGTETESLYTGPVALRSVSPEARREILSLFPELAEEGFAVQPARLLTSGRQGRRLAYRHARNQQELVY